MDRSKSSAQHPGKVLHQQKQMMGVGQAGLEVEMPIERRSRLVLGMDKQGAYPRNVRRCRATQQRILEQRGSQMLTLLTPVNDQTRQNHQLDGMAGQALRNPGGCVRVVGLPHGQTVIAHHLSAPTHHIGYSGPQKMDQGLR